MEAEGIASVSRRLRGSWRIDVPITGPLVCAANQPCVSGFEAGYSLPYKAVGLTIFVYMALGALAASQSIGLYLLFIAVVIALWLPTVLITMIGGRDELSEWAAAAGSGGIVALLVAIVIFTSAAIVQQIYFMGFRVYIELHLVNVSLVNFFDRDSWNAFNCRSILSVRLALAFAKFFFHFLLLLAWAKPDIKLSCPQLRRVAPKRELEPADQTSITTHESTL